MNDKIRPGAIMYYTVSIWNLLRKSNWWSGFGIGRAERYYLKLIPFLLFWSRRLMDIWTVKEVVLDDVYRINNVINKGDVVIDIGAATGDFCITAAFKGAKVYAYEPDRDRLELLGMNLKQNAISNITVHRCAAKSLDDIFLKDQIRSCKFLKVDCEGDEYEIFDHASKQTLRKISNMAMEIHLFNNDMEKNYGRLKEILISNGFILTEADNQVHTNVRYLYANKQ